jgi:DNA-binding SARP family transcriptional activator/tetratricopeptide (TPR) repeat protein
MEIRLLGPLDVREGDRPIALPRRQQRALLAALALRAGEVVSTDRLVADLWGERAPASATGSLQNTISALRKLLGRDLLVTQPPGYRLAIDPERVDANRFERLLEETRHAEPARRAALLTEALDLWHGPALADLDEEGFARLEAGRLDELRIVALEERIEAELELGRHGALAGELEALVAAHPLRERLRGQLMVALYRCGRQAEALEVYRAARLALADELGLDPSPELQELERRVLRQDPSLAAPGEIEREAEAPVFERRLITVLAVTPPVDDDPETMRRRLDEVLTAVRGVLIRHDGELERFGPEGLVVVFGSEAARDDDALRAVRAAAELGLPAGVATGESVGGAGAVFTRAVELARGSGVQVDDRTRALVQDERRLDAPLVGRAEELRRLRMAFDLAAAERRCRIVTVLGEPGIGKTRLGRELAESLAPVADTLIGRCVSYGKGLTFLPLLDALREVDATAAMASDPEGALASTRLAALDGAPDAGTLGESYWAVRRLLESLARTRPVVLLLDDVHWAEPALLDLVDYLGERVVDAPLLLVNLARPDLARPAGEQVALGPLTDDEARELVSGFAELDEDTLDQVVELAEGNALYAEQLASFAAEGGEGLPPTLEAVLAGRLGRLADSERAVLQRAAVAGREFSRGAVAALSEDPVDEALSSLSRRGFVHPATGADPGDDGYRFHHVLLRDAAYASLTKADRAELHERTAAWLDRDGPGDDTIVGYHLERAAALKRDLGEDAAGLDEAAGRRLGDAAMRAWRLNDTSAAIGLLDRSIQRLPPSERRAELLWELGIALRIAGRPAEADTALVRAEREAAAIGAKVMQARVSVEQTRAAVLAGETELADAAERTIAAIASLESADDARGLGRAHLIRAIVHGFACDFSFQETAAAVAAEHYARAGFSPAACYAAQATALFYGPTPVAEAMLRCTELLDATPDRMAQANVTAVLGAFHALRGRFDEARTLLDRARATYADLGSRSAPETMLAPLAATVERLAGRTNDAVLILQASYDALATEGDRTFVSTRAGQLAEVLLDLARVEEAAEYLDVAEQQAAPSDVLVQFLWRSGKARLLARGERREEAATLAREAVAISSLTDALIDRAWTHAALAEVLAAGGALAEAKREAAEAARLLDEKGVEREREPVGSLSLR